MLETENIKKEEHIFSSDDKLKWWGYGEWIEEPDLVQFEYKGYQCVVKRIAFQEKCIKEFHVYGGFLCGYVQISNELFFNEKGFDLDYDVHGGITYNEINEDGKNWIGFDCTHCNDIAPSMEKLYNTNADFIKIKEDNEKLLKGLGIKNNSFFNKTYKNIGFCIGECKSLVDQIINDPQISS